MGVKHVTIYECDACESKVDGNAELTKVTVGQYKYEVCMSCLRSINDVLVPTKARSARSEEVESARPV